MRKRCAKKACDRKYHFFSTRNRLFKGRGIKELVERKGIRCEFLFLRIIDD